LNSRQIRYLRQSLETKDIRDKPEKGITGYFDTNGKIKEEYTIDLQKIFDRFYPFLIKREHNVNCN